VLYIALVIVISIGVGVGLDRGILALTEIPSYTICGARTSTVAPKNFILVNVLPLNSLTVLGYRGWLWTHCSHIEQDNEGRQTSG
jgi:hypothetical protein